MKKTIILLMAIMLVGNVTFAQTKKKHAHKHTSTTRSKIQYTCSMDPDVVMAKPGKCPKCGMKLIPMRIKTDGGNERMKK